MTTLFFLTLSPQTLVILGFFPSHLTVNLSSHHVVSIFKINPESDHCYQVAQATDISLLNYFKVSDRFSDFSPARLQSLSDQPQWVFQEVHIIPQLRSGQWHPSPLTQSKVKGLRATEHVTDSHEPYLVPSPIILLQPPSSWLLLESAKMFPT